jgi:hypothetical protein
MKQILHPSFLLLLILFSFPGFFNKALAAAPTDPAKDVKFYYEDGDRIRISWSNGNGTSRIIVMRKESPVTALPLNGTAYTANSVFGSGAEIQTEQYVVGNVSNVSSVDVTGLLPATKYYVAIFESNGTGFQTQYLTAAFATGAFTTSAAPLQQASDIQQTEVTGNKINLKWLPGDGKGRILIARKGAPVNVNPVDLKVYDGSSTFGNGSQIGNGNFVIQHGWLNTASITSLENSTTYHFAVFEYNGGYGPVYQTTTPARFSATTAPRPTAPSYGMQFSSVDGSEFSVTVNTGNGTRRMVIARAGSEVTAVPQDGVAYTANSVFGSGTNLGGNQYVVGAGIGNSFKISGLQPGTTYHVAVFEYDGEGVNAHYLTSSFAKGSQATLVAPIKQASDIVVSNVLTTSATIKYTRGNGDKTLIVVREGSPVNATPTDLVNYLQSPNFGGGAQVGAGNYVVSFSSATTINVATLAANKTYYVKAFEASGNSFPVYNTTNAPEASFSTSARPSQPAANIDFSYVEGNSMRIGWSSGNGTRRVIIAAEGAAVTALPQDGVTYTANANFGSGQQILPGQYVVYDDNGGSMYLKALQSGKTYHVAIFEYSLDGLSPSYLTAQFAAKSRATLTAPTTPATAISYPTITSNSIALKWTPGDGTGRILIARAGAPVTATLTDLAGYTSGTTIGTGSNLGNGNYVITSGNISGATVYGLQKGVRYYFKIVEYNGSTGPVYLQSSSLTGDAMTVDRPTTAATNPGADYVEGNSIRFKWSNGNGERRVVIAKAGSAVTSVPVDGVQYTANNVFGSGQKVGEGEYVVADGNLSAFDLKGLQSGTYYFIKVFEYDDLGVKTAYMTENALSFSRQTLVAPAVQAKNITGSGATASTTTVGVTIGDGQKRLIVARAGQPVNFTPADYTSYTANASFGAGTDLGDGHFVVHSGAEPSVIVSNLQTGATYYFAAFEFNGTTGPVYLKTSPATGNVTTIGPPTESAKNPSFTNPLAIGSVQLNWQNGTGHRRLVVMKEGSPVDFTPVDKVMYTPNSFFGSGEMVGNNNYVVFSGTNNFVNVTNLNKTKTYYFAVFEFNFFPDGPRYRLQDPMTVAFDAIVLPVKWISFAGSQKSNGAQLEWTIEEKDNARFEVEGSDDGRTFRQITTIASKGDGQNTYRYNHANASAGAWYYRIKQVDKNGAYTYSAVVKVATTGSSVMEVKQTLVTSQLTITIQAANAEKGQLFVTDAAGRTVQTVRAKSGTNILSTVTLNSGMYFLTYVDGGNKPQTVRFVKQ